MWLGSPANTARLEDLDEVECELEGAGRVPVLAVLSVNDSLCDLMTTTEKMTTERLLEQDEIFGTVSFLLEKGQSPFSKRYSQTTCATSRRRPSSRR